MKTELPTLPNGIATDINALPRRLRSKGRAMHPLASRAFAAMLTVVALLRRLVPKDMPALPMMFPMRMFFISILPVRRTNTPMLSTDVVRFRLLDPEELGLEAPKPTPSAPIAIPAPAPRLALQPAPSGDPSDEVVTDMFVREPTPVEAATVAPPEHAAELIDAAAFRRNAARLFEL